MEKDYKFGRGNLKGYDFVVFALIIVVAILVAVLNGALQLNMDAGLFAIVVMGVEMAYIFGVVNRRGKKN